jgi:DMSO reductase anchor subunit
MRPALSIIFFTTLSGAGYGLWFMIGLALAFGLYPEGRGGLLVALAIGLALTSIGLLCSVAHLGKPLRAWRALSQWRSSWLSREGIAALACVPLVLTLAWRARDFHDVPKLRIAGFLLALMAVLVVFCTARIYTSLRTISAWHNRRVLPMFMLLAIETGALWLWALMALREINPINEMQASNASLPWLFVLAAILIVTALLKRSYWRHIDDDVPTSSPETATGLGRIGSVRSVEHPHTEANYLTHEMGFVLARRHAARLRAITSYLLFSIPLLMIGITTLMPQTETVAALIALACATLGVFVERWLFFAQARHAVMLYYGVRNR